MCVCHGHIYTSFSLSLSIYIYTYNDVYIWSWSEFSTKPTSLSLELVLWGRVDFVWNKHRCTRWNLGRRWHPFTRRVWLGAESQFHFASKNINWGSICTYIYIYILFFPKLFGQWFKIRWMLASRSIHHPSRSKRLSKKSKLTMLGTQHHDPAISKYAYSEYRYIYIYTHCTAQFWRGLSEEQAESSFCLESCELGANEAVSYCREERWPV